MKWFKRYNKKKVEDGIAIIKNGGSPEDASLFCGVPHQVLVKWFFITDIFLPGDINFQYSLAKKEPYWETELEILNSLSKPKYNFNELKPSEIKSYLNSIQNKWMDDNYKTYILKNKTS